MVPILALSACAADTMAWRLDGNLRLSVIVKAHFRLPPAGALELLPPEALHAADVHRNNLPQASVLQSSDRVPMRPRADVTLVGHAQALTPVRSTTVRLTLLRKGRLLVNKTLVVRSDVAQRTFPLRYELAFGGAGHAENPIGVERPSIRYQKDERRTACFGPIPASWAPRSARAGKIDPRALDQAIAELPSDVDWAFFQCAPADQQTTYLVGDEELELDGLHAQHQRLKVQLPGARAVGAIFGVGASDGQDRTLIGFDADALHFDVDRGDCALSWRGVVELPDETVIPRLLVCAGVALVGKPVVVPQSRPAVRASTPALDAPAPAPGPLAQQRRSAFGDATLNLELETAPALEGGSVADLLSSLGVVPVAAPFPLAKPGARRAVKPRPATPWQEAAQQPVVPAKPGQETTLGVHLEADEADLAAPLPAGSSTKDVLAWLGVAPEQPARREKAPFPLANPRPTGASRPDADPAPPAGAPWAGSPAGAVPRPSPDQDGTLGLDLEHDEPLPAPPVAAGVPEAGAATASAGTSGERQPPEAAPVAAAPVAKPTTAWVKGAETGPIERAKPEPKRRATRLNAVPLIYGGKPGKKGS